MQVQQFASQVAPATQENEMEQLALLFAQQQLAVQEADAVVQRESEKTLAVFQSTIDAQAAENRALQNENAVLRERLAAMEAQRREADAAHVAEAKAKDSRHAEEIAALEEKNKSQQRVLDALDKAVQEHAEFLKKTAEHYDPNSESPVQRLTYTLFTTHHSLSVQQHERAMQGVYKKRPEFNLYNGVVHYTKE